MFWKKKKKDGADYSGSIELSEFETNICRSPSANMDLRRAVLDWRDKHIENVELHLSREIVSLCNALDERANKMTYKDLFSQKEFGEEKLNPIYKDWVEREVMHLINAAQKDLSAVFVRALECSEHGATLKHEEGNGPYADVGVAVVATAAGLATIPAVAALSVVSAGGVAGILGFTAISWPVVVVGSAAAAVLLLLGGYKAAHVKSRAISRYQRAVSKEIKKQVLGTEKDNESICQHLQLHISKTAELIIMEIDNGNTI